MKKIIALVAAAIFVASLCPSFTAAGAGAGHSSTGHYSKGRSTGSYSSRNSSPMPTSPHWKWNPPTGADKSTDLPGTEPGKSEGDRFRTGQGREKVPKDNGIDPIVPSHGSGAGAP